MDPHLSIEGKFRTDERCAYNCETLSLSLRSIDFARIRDSSFTRTFTINRNFCKDGTVDGLSNDGTVIGSTRLVTKVGMNVTRIH